jgi:hypothetical protein
MSEPRDIWNDRPVTFAEFTIAEGKQMLKAYARDQEEGMHHLLVLSLRYADTGEPVFKSVAEIEALPFRHNFTLGRLASKAGFLNGMRSDPDAPTPAANGEDKETAAGPPH